MSSGVKGGLCLGTVMRPTAPVFVNDHESGRHHDYLW
jgi:thiamine phosphate synthase YjbQ (UPF0047 family)